MNIHRPLAVLLILITSTGSANPRIAVLDFELNDITSLPNTPAELARTRSMAPLLIDTFKQTGCYQTVDIPLALQRSANSSFGYLYRFPDEAAKFGQQQNVDWIVVSQHSKPSYLFSYLWVYLVEVSTKTPIARFDIELKGTHEKVTQHAIASLAKKIRAAIANH